MPSFRSVFFRSLVVAACLGWTLPAFAAPPVATDDVLVTSEDVPAGIDVLDNDTDPDGDTLEITHVDGRPITDGGAAVMVAGGQVGLSLGDLVYLPDPDVHGSFSFTYTVSDGTESSNGTVAVTLEPVPDASVVDLSGPLAVTVDPARFVAVRFGTPMVSNEGQTEEADGVGNGETLFFSNAATVGATPVDIVATVVRNTTGRPAPLTITSEVVGVRLEANGELLVRFEVFEAGTSNPVEGDFRFFIDDLDGFRIKDGIRVSPDDLDGYTLDARTGITVFPDEVRFVGANQGPSLRPEAALEIEILETSRFEIAFLHQPNPRTEGGRGITLDGEFSSIFPTARRQVIGGGYATEWVAGDPAEPVSAADADVYDVENDIEELRIHLDPRGVTADRADEVWIVGSLEWNPSMAAAAVTIGGVTYALAFSGETLTVTRAGGGTLSAAEVAAFIRSIRYDNRAAAVTEGDRILGFTTLDSGGATSAPVESVITVRVPVCGDGVVEGFEDCDDGTVPVDGMAPFDRGCCNARCQYRAAGEVCRTAAALCDAEETCSGASAACPTDALLVAGTECREAAGACDTAEQCDGTNSACPADVLVVADTVCREAAGACDVEERCDGAGPACPSDTLVAAGMICRASTDVCDPAETCDGASGSCPDDGRLADGTACADGTTCNGDELCMAGVCTAGAAVDCNDDNLCTTDLCAEPDGCGHAPIAGCCNLDADCNDGDICTVNTCSGPGGSCSASPITDCCMTDADCHDDNNCTTDVCDTSTNRCMRSPVPGCCSVDGDCDDGNGCTQDVCDTASGSCQNTELADCCVTDGDCNDGMTCTTDRCDPASMTCSQTPDEGCCTVDTDCDDANACTTDRCNVDTATCTQTPIEDCGADAGVGPDGSLPDGGVVTGGVSGGAGCSVGASRSGSTTWLLLLLLAVVARRRKATEATARS